MARKTTKRKTAKRKTPDAVSRPKVKDIKPPSIRMRKYERAIEKTVRRLANTHGSPFAEVLGELLEGGDAMADGACIECSTLVPASGNCNQRGCERRLSRDVYKRVSR